MINMPLIIAIVIHLGNQMMCIIFVNVYNAVNNGKSSLRNYCITITAV